jgi:glutamate/tyrosine decarboxylase-like PLP-dependent enzyme
MAESNMEAGRDEEFNTRYGSFRGSQMAIERVKPIVRDAAQTNLTGMIMAAKLKTSDQAVDYLIHRFMTVPPDDATRKKLTAFLTKELGTTDIAAAQTYMEQPLRLLLHLIMSQPEFQLS